MVIGWINETFYILHNFIRFIRCYGAGLPIIKHNKKARNDSKRYQSIDYSNRPAAVVHKDPPGGVPAGISPGPTGAPESMGGP